MEGVRHARVLNQLCLLTRSPQPLAVPDLPIVQGVDPTDQHDCSWEICKARDINRVGSTDVGCPVVSVGPLGQEGPPVPVGPGNTYVRFLPIPDLGLGPLRPAKERLDRYKPSDSHLPRLQLRRPHCHMVRNVSAGTVSGDEAPRHICIPGEQ